MGNHWYFNESIFLKIDKFWSVTVPPWCSIDVTCLLRDSFGTILAWATLETRSWKSPSARAWKFCRVRTLLFCGTNFYLMLSNLSLMFRSFNVKVWLTLTLHGISTILLHSMLHVKLCMCSKSPLCNTILIFPLSVPSWWKLLMLWALRLVISLEALHDNRVRTQHFQKGVLGPYRAHWKHDYQIFHKANVCPFQKQCVFWWWGWHQFEPWHSISQPPMHPCFVRAIGLIAHPKITLILSFSWGFSSKVTFCTS